MDLIPESPETEVGTSKEDRLALISMNQSKRLVDGYYQLALPWKPGAPILDNNRTIAESRLNNLKKRFGKNADLHKLRGCDIRLPGKKLRRKSGY